MHIPKTAGTALTAALAALPAQRAVLSAFDHCLYGNFRAFETMDPHIQAGIYATPADLPPDCDLITGHFARGTLRAINPQASIITVLREPFSRLLSHWQYWRQHTDASMAALGAWTAYIRLSRLPLAEFLGQKMIACQTDNIITRMLLWPHELIPADEFIEPAHDQTILQEASARLNELQFADFVENPKFIANLQGFLGKPLTFARMMETSHLPAENRAPLPGEFTARAYALLTERSRLDAKLWHSVAARHLPESDIAALRERSLLTNVARYAVLNARECDVSPDAQPSTA
jgi:hypothetical protein